MSHISLQPTARSLLLRYGLSVLSSGLALWLTLLLSNPSTEPKTFLLFLAAVMLSSWYGGLGPGLLATFIAALTGAYYFLPPSFTRIAYDLRSSIRLSEFVIVALLISSLNAARLSAQRRAEEAFLEADKANRSKDVFLATVTHELRTPLVSMLGWVRMLRAGQLTEANFARALEALERNAKTQALLIDDLLDVARITAGKMRLDVRPVELASVIEAAIDVVRPAAKAKNILLEVALDREVGPVSGDPDRLQQVVWNLLSNAIKFTPHEGRIRIRLERAGSSAQIIVSDTGCGIRAELLPHIFERFRQADGAAIREYGGLGLGLTIVRHLVELHGGTVQAESRGEGRGASFIVKLPLTTSPAGALDDQIQRQQVLTNISAAPSGRFNSLA